MTNFEWLVVNGKLTNFLEEVACSRSITVAHKYGIPDEPDSNRFTYDKIAEWLKAERRATEYVKKDDVLRICPANDTIAKLGATGSQSVYNVGYNEGANEYKHRIEALVGEFREE